MPPRQRAQRKNPLIPVDDKPFAPSEVASAPAPMLIDSPICGQCWPDGWASLGDGDYASCPHGEWSTKESFVPRFDVPVCVNDGPIAQFVAGHMLDGVTTDGVHVKIEIREGQPARVSLANPIPLAPAPDVDQWDAGVIARAKLGLPEQPVSPFSPKPAPAPVEVDPTELDSGEDVMFMPSGG